MQNKHEKGKYRNLASETIAIRYQQQAKDAALPVCSLMPE